MGRYNVWNRVKIFTIADLMLPLEKNEVRFLIASGNDVSVLYNEQNILMKQGDFLILNANSERSIIGSTEAILVSLFINETEYINYGNISDKVEGSSAIKLTESDKEIQESLLNLIKIKINEARYTEADILKNYYTILALIYRDYMVVDVSERQKIDELGVQATKAYEIREYVQQNYKKGITLDSVAAKFYLSSPYLSRLFKKVFKISFHKYVAKLRVESAKNELINSEKSITDIAFDNGFPNVGSLNTLFKRQYEKTPGAYRTIYKEKQRQEKAAREYLEPREQMEKISSIQEKNDNQPTLKNIQNLFKYKSSELSQSWRKIINVGPAGLVALSSMNSQIKRVQKDINFEYGRIFALFTDEMLMINEYNSDTIRYGKIDDTIEVLIRNGLKPMIELGIKELNIHMNYSERIKNIATYSYYGNPKLDLAGFLNDFIRHCITKWGYDNVKTWMFELWLPSQTVTTSKKEQSYSEKDLNAYLAKFALIKKSIKSIVPEIKVGGCGLSIDIDHDITEKILRKWQEKEMPDFFSIYLYPQKFENEDGIIKNEVFMSSNMMRNMIDDTKRVMKDTNFINVPLYVTEWNISISDRNYIHDSLFKANFMIDSILNCAGKVAMMGYWQLSDLYGSLGTSNELLHGGAGLLSIDGIPKPSYLALEMLELLSKDKLYYRDDNMIITAHDAKKINLIVYNMKKLNSIYHLKKENDVQADSIESVFDDVLPLHQVVRVNDIQSGRYHLRKMELDKENGDLLNQWLQWGKPTDFNQNDLEYLSLTCRPKWSLYEVAVKDFLDIEVNVAANSIIMYQIYKKI